MEIFKMLEEFPAYRVSNKGRVQSRWKMGGHYNGFVCKERWKTLKLSPDGSGYLQVNLTDGHGGGRTYRVHVLVAKCFLGDRPENMDLVRHLDSNPKNNNVENLCYGTYLDNENDKIENGTWGIRYGGAKLTPSEVTEIRIKLKNGCSQKGLAKEYNVTRPTVTRISNNKIWRNVI